MPVSGHSNTVPLILEAFIGVPGPPMSDDDDDDLYIITAWGNGSSVTRLKYGPRGA